MTALDHVAMQIIMSAAEEAKYSTRRSPDGVGIIAPAKVCRFCEALHKRIVAELEKLTKEST